jgi:hypothetical protein
VTIPDSVTWIGDGAFADCSSLTSITIPDSVTKIGNAAFLNCNSLKRVIVHSRFAQQFKEQYGINIIPSDKSNMHEGAEPESDEYNIGMEGDSNLEYGHVFEGIEKDFDYKSSIKSILDYMSSEGLEIKPYPSITLKWNDQNGLFITTGYYSPIEKRVVLFCKDRHPKDILRSFCHELIHHMQNIQGKNMNFTNADDVKDNKELEELESEAYLKGNIYFRKWTEYERKKDNVLNEAIISISQLRELTKELDESLEPNEVDLSSFNIKRNLNPKFWKNDKLDSRIRMKLLDIADDFIDYLGVDWVKPEDITITGSLANFNWNEKYSDIDLHIIMDYSKVDKRKDFVSNYFYSLKKNWNEEHEDLKIYGFPIEVYVQDKNEKHTSSGVYSLEKNEWIDEPERNKIAKVKVNKTIIKNKVSKYTKDIDSLEDEFRKVKKDNYKLRKLSDKAEKIFNKLKSERKESLKTSNSEITEGNIIFKCLRRNGYIEKLDKIISDIYNKMNSLS